MLPQLLPQRTSAYFCVFLYAAARLCAPRRVYAATADIGAHAPAPARLCALLRIAECLAPMT